MQSLDTPRGFYFGRGAGKGVREGHISIIVAINTQICFHINRFTKFDRSLNRP